MKTIHEIAELMGNQEVSRTLARLLIAAILGGIIGLERQLRHKPAGLRTNMFICLGAALFTVLSKELAGVPADSARIAAQIIPGIGFIGAGSILHARGSVTGLTTAATLFVIASVGMAVGGGLYRDRPGALQKEHERPGVIQPQGRCRTRPNPAARRQPH